VWVCGRTGVWEFEELLAPKGYLACNVRLRFCASSPVTLSPSPEVSLYFTTGEWTVTSIGLSFRYRASTR